MSYTEIIEQRLHFLCFDKETLATMKKIQSILEPSIDHVLDRFEVQIAETPEIMAFFPSKDSILITRKALRKHWIDILFSGEIGKAHFDNAERIGQTHERIGLSLSHYLGGYCFMLNQFHRVISDHFHDDNIGMTQMIQALNKAVFLDISSVIDSYLEAKDHAIQKVLVQAEQFSSSIKKNNSSLGVQATDHQSYLQALCNKGKSITQRTLELENKISRINNKKFNSSDNSNKELAALLQESAALLKANREINLEIDKAKLQASQLADQINNLNSHYDKLKAHHKCYFTMDQKQPLLQKIKSFISKN
mgnify:CR=1 FL=1